MTETETSGARSAAGPSEPAGALPLDGIRVIDAGRCIAGPHAAVLMGEFGAEVLKIERPAGGDPLRRLGTASARPNASLAWLSEARNKKSVTLDLRTSEGAALFLRLIAKSDVLIENFRPGRLEGWGLGWEVLRRANPGLVMLRVSGYGQTGPYRHWPGFGHLAQAFGGLAHLAGFPGGPPVMPGSPLLGDYMAGLYGAAGILLALRRREKTGRGQAIDIAVFEAVFRQLDELAVAYGLSGRVRPREGAGTAMACPHGHFLTGDDKWVAIACTNDKMFARLAGAAMGRPDLASADRYGPQARRLAAREEVDRIVAGWARSLSREELLDICLKAEVPAGPLNSIADIFADPHALARKAMTRVVEDDVGEVAVPSVMPRLSRTPGRIANLGPALGNATDAVLREMLGCGVEELERLRRTGAI